MEWTANIERHLIGTTDSKRIFTYFMKTINDSAPTKEKELDLAAPESTVRFFDELDLVRYVLLQ